ncbi:longitudinals lacking isoform X3 [Rhynchophorus ferrugineus]|uniref:longitudinals lacking isoform X3 n=1 Tax=Rhynchophorus ferrugineus TaxID=354439 RepID=UPI003FCCF0C6
MDDDQQFCLRWNNHQSTLVAVFDTLLENGTLVDCTLAAEGKFLNAHKVVLSACSPYFEALLSRHYDKHPILILKDVKFQELKAMMDYMYRGEVNISQDQLGALLKAAESLQIKGLSDNKKEEPAKRPAPAPAPPKSPQPQAQLPKVQGLTIEQRSRDDREGSMSPGLRKKKRMRRKSEDMDNHDASNSSDAHSMSSQNIPSATSQISTANKMNSSDLPDTIETKQEIMTRHKEEAGSQQQVPMIKEKLETHTELMLEPKSEYVEEMNEDSIEDLTLDDDDISNMEQVDEGAGPSHGGEGSSQQGFGHWQMGNQSQDEVFLAAQEAVGAHRDSQDDDDRNADMLGDDGAVIKRSKLTHTARHEPSDNMVLSLRDLVNTNAIVDFGQQSDDGHSLSRDPIFEISQIESMMEGESMDDDAPFEHEIFCSLCHTVFSHASSLRYHMKHRVCLKPKKEDMEPKILQCQKCEKVFATGSGYKYHVRRSVCEQEEEKEEEVIQCDKCNTTFRHKTSLQYHITHKVCLKPKKDEEPKSLQCEQCEKIFSTTTALNYHVKNQVCAPKEPKEPKEEEKICTLCNAVFKHSTSLRYHLKHKVCLKPKKEETEPRVLQCLLCEKIFTSNSSLEYHVKRRVCEQQKVALQGPPYLCDICNCSFELRQTWYAHIKRQVCKKYPERYMQEGDFETSVKIEME